MEQSVKKKSAHNIYYGIQEETGTLMHISEVSSGMGCSCNCVACGTALEARKGKIRRHHFAHVSNYDCMYADEVAVYKACAVIISNLTSFYLPPIYFSLNNRHEPELLKDAQQITHDNVTFECEPKQYPPMLLVTILGSKLRLLLEFGTYYSEDDLQVLAEEGRNYNYSVLLYHLPNIGEEDFFTPAHLAEIWSDGKLGQRWIRSALEDKKREYYISLAATPKEWGSGYECPIHISKYRGKYSARRVDCAYCEYNLAQAPNCLCLALAGPRLPALHEKVIKLQQINDAHIQQLEENAAKRQPRSDYHPSPPLIPAPSGSTPPQPLFEVSLAEEIRIKDSFDPLSTEPLWDKYNRRWAKCTCCGELKQTKDMSSYGGRGIECNLGICLNCARQRRNNL